MTDRSQRPPVRIRLKYNSDTGEVEELLIDDGAPDCSEEYHDRVADAVARLLSRNPEVEDAGPRGRPPAATGAAEERPAELEGKREVRRE